MMHDVQPQNFDALIKLSGFSHGTGVWRGNAKDLIKSGTVKIDGIISSRDDIMLYLLSKGMDRQTAYKIMEHIRKGLGLSDDEREKMKAVSVPDWYIESCEKIQYLFPMAHAATYVMMAFRIAWFKVHEPLAFYSAYFYRRSQRYVFDAESMTHGIDIVRAKIQEIKKLRDPSMSDENMLTTLEACYEFYLRGFSFASADPDKADAEKFLVSGERELRAPLGVHTTV
jgi:DNA polymerase-3 subunit alpha (Gram-positive type)